MKKKVKIGTTRRKNSEDKDGEWSLGDRVRSYGEGNTDPTSRPVDCKVGRFLGHRVHSFEEEDTVPYSRPANRKVGRFPDKSPGSGLSLSWSRAVTAHDGLRLGRRVPFAIPGVCLPEVRGWSSQNTPNILKKFFKLIVNL